MHQILGFRRRGYRTTLAPSANRRLEIPCEAAGKANHWMLGRLWGGFAAPDRGWRWAPLLLFLATVTYWVFAERAADKYPNYMSNEATVVLRTPPAALLGPLVMPDQPDYQVFYPLGYNLLVAVDRFIIAPIALGPQATDPGVFSKSGSRLAWVELTWLGLIAAACFFFLKRLTDNRKAALIGTAYLGLNHGFSHGLYFVTSFGVYPMLLGVMLALDALAEVCRGSSPPSPRQFLRVAFGVVVAVLSYGQAGALPVVMIVVTVATIFYLRRPVRQLGSTGLFLPVIGMAIFLYMQVVDGLHVTSQVSEEQFVFSYPSVLQMIEDMILNISFHIAYGLDSIFIPWPMFSVSVLGNMDMNIYNRDNTFNAQFPNIAYRTLGLWYVGILFTIAVWLSVKLILVLYKERGRVENLPAVFGLALFWGGFFMHIPIMFRDYFLIPGHDIGYKAAQSHLGVAVLVAWVAARWLLPWAARRLPGHQGFVIAVCCCWLLLCNFSKVALNAGFGFRYPW